jgi:hypothetical protein
METAISNKLSGQCRTLGILIEGPKHVLLKSDEFANLFEKF